MLEVNKLIELGKQKEQESKAIMDAELASPFKVMQFCNFVIEFLVVAASCNNQKFDYNVAKLHLMIWRLRWAAC